MYCFSLSEKTGFVIYFIQATPFILIVTCLKTKCNKGSLISEKSDSKCCRTFLAGAQGLEP